MTEVGGPPAQVDRPRSPTTWLGLDLALWVLLAYLVVAFFAIVFHFGRPVWFRGDELGFLADRSLSDPLGWFAPQNSHWSTAPIFIYQLIYAVVGLHSYAPYQAAVVAMHLTLVLLIWVVMRRAGVRPWVATFVASSFVLFGLGHENIVAGVQVSQVGSMVYGFGHAILADHDGRFRRRDLAGLGLGLLSVISSGVGPAMVIAVGLAVLLRRGWRMAMIHTAPLGAVYYVWYRTYDDEIGSNWVPSPPLSTLAEWVVTNVTGVLESLTSHWVPAAILGGVMLVGLVLSVRTRTWSGLRTRAAVPLAFAVGALVLSASIGHERWLLGMDFARSSRYVAMGAALMLPLIGLTMDAVIRRWRVAAPALVLLLALGVPGNVRAFTETGWPPAFYEAYRVSMTLTAHHPCLDLAPGDLVPDPAPFTGGRVDVAFLIEARDAGKVPRPPDRVSVLTIAGVEESLGFGGLVEEVPEGVLCDGTLVPGAKLDG